MVQHASDCALYDVSTGPDVCSCGASPLFRRWVYNANEDIFGFRLECREVLICMCVQHGLFSGWLGNPGRHVALRRAVNEGFEPEEMSAFLQQWRNATLIDPEDLRRRGVPDCLLAPDLSALSPQVRAAIAREPDMAEIQAVMQPWIEHWRSLPKPAAKLGIAA